MIMFAKGEARYGGKGSPTDDITLENTPINCGEYYYFMGQERVYVKQVHRSEMFSNQVMCLVAPDGESYTYIIAESLTKNAEDFDLKAWDEYLKPFKQAREQYEEENKDNPVIQFRKDLREVSKQCKQNRSEFWSERAERLAREKALGL